MQFSFFFVGRPCYYRDFTHVDWVPSLLLGNKPNNTTRNQSDSDIDELGCQLFNTPTIRQESPERNVSTESAEPLKIVIRKDVASSPTVGGTITRKRRGKKRKRLNAPPKRSKPTLQQSQLNSRINEIISIYKGQSKKSSSTLKKVDDNDFHFVSIENEQSNSTDTASENEDVLAVCTDPQPCCTNQDCLNEKRLLQSQLDGAQEQIAILRAQLEENAQTLCAYLNTDGGSNMIVVKTERDLQ